MITDVKHRRIESRAPTRIDLAGGTLDIWPLYLMLNRPATLNVAIDLYADARIDETQGAAPAGDGTVTLRSDDQGASMTFRWDDLNAIEPPPSLDLHVKLLRFFVQSRGPAIWNEIRSSELSLSTFARSPAGAGIGGSSALGIATVGALASWVYRSGAMGEIDPLRDGEHLIQIVKDIETTVIRVPAGLQDYYSAMFGGVQCLGWAAGQHRREPLSHELLPELESRLLLFYSGQSRNSGINNWALFKSFIDRENNVRERFQKIADATRALDESLRAKNWNQVAQAIAQEWEIRRTLAPGITTSEIDHAFSVAHAAGAVAGKVCGAGGGGCFFVFLPVGDEALRTRVRNAVVATGVRCLDFKIAPRGLDIQVQGA